MVLEVARRHHIRRLDVTRTMKCDALQQASVASADFDGAAPVEALEGGREHLRTRLHDMQLPAPVPALQPRHAQFELGAGAIDLVEVVATQPIRCELGRSEPLGAHRHIEPPERHACLPQRTGAGGQFVDERHVPAAERGLRRRLAVVDRADPEVVDL